MYFEEFNTLLPALKERFNLPCLIDDVYSYNFLLTFLTESELDLVQDVQDYIDEEGLSGDAEVHLFDEFVCEYFKHSSMQISDINNFIIHELPQRVFYNDAKESIDYIKSLDYYSDLEKTIITNAILANEIAENRRL